MLNERGVHLTLLYAHVERAHVLSSSHTDFRSTVIFLCFVIKWAAGKQKNEHVQAGGDHHRHLCAPVVNRNCSYYSTRRHCLAFTAGEQGDLALSGIHFFCMNSCNYPGLRARISVTNACNYSDEETCEWWKQQRWVARGEMKKNESTLYVKWLLVVGWILHEQD